MLRARRAVVQAEPLPPSLAQSAAAAQAQAAQRWSERQTRELARQRALQQDRWLDAALDSVAAAGSQRPDGAALAARELATQRRRDAYLRQQERTAQLKASRPEELPPGSRIWFAPGLWEKSMRATLLERAWQRVEDLAVAAAMVAHAPGTPPKRAAFVAGMTGAAIISATYLSNPRRGCRVQYHRALRVPQALWISGGCRGRFPEGGGARRAVGAAGGRQDPLATLHIAGAAHARGALCQRPSGTPRPGAEQRAGGPSPAPGLGEDDRGRLRAEVLSGGHLASAAGSLRPLSQRLHWACGGEVRPGPGHATGLADSEESADSKESAREEEREGGNAAALTPC